MCAASALFTPCVLGSLVLENRFVMPAMQRGWCVNGAPSPQMAAYYQRRAAGGVALIISESCAIDHPSATRQPAAAWINPATQRSWAQCIDEVHRAGGRMLIQLWHEGGLREATDGQTISPMGYGRPDHPNGRAATPDDLREIRASFIRSAVVAQDAGADGVEVHAAHGFLLDQFLWPATNARDDRYGGATIDDRSRLAAEIVAGIRDRCGADFVISLRFSQWKECDYAARIVEQPAELARFLGLMREAGVDGFHVSTRRFWQAAWPESDLTLAGWTRMLGGLPTIAVGSVGLDRDVMESLTDTNEARSCSSRSVAKLAKKLAGGEFDLIAVGRSLIGDPEWVEKVRRGRYDEIRSFQRSDLADLQWEIERPG